ncbi:MAG: hypothetical protein QF858_02940 [Candidatus Pacebacteria bacterium]|nr:hypothetical protein [Candidatus Paceibacterota bacterium]HCI03403.1 hypothetical protein [Candidatus Peribacteria bacterium]
MSNENPGIRLKVECETDDVSSARNWLARVKNEILELFESKERGSYGISVSDLSGGAEVVEAERTLSSDNTLVVDEKNQPEMLLGAVKDTSRIPAENIPGIQVDVVRPKKGNKRIGKWVLELREALIALIQSEAGDLNGKAVITYSDKPDGDEIFIAEAVQADGEGASMPDIMYIGDDAPESGMQVEEKEIETEEPVYSNNVIGYKRRDDGRLRRRDDGRLDLWVKGSRPSDDSEGESPFAPESGEAAEQGSIDLWINEDQSPATGGDSPFAPESGEAAEQGSNPFRE